MSTSLLSIMNQTNPAGAEPAKGTAQFSQADRPDASLRLALDRILLDLAEIKKVLVGQRKPYLTIAEVAGMVGRSEYTVRRWITEKRINAIRIDGSGPRGRLLVPHDELARLVDEGRGGAVPGSALAN